MKCCGGVGTSLGDEMMTNKLKSSHDTICPAVIERYQSNKEIIGCWILNVNNNQQHNKDPVKNAKGLESILNHSMLQDRSFWYNDIPDWELLYAIENITPTSVPTTTATTTTSCHHQQGLGYVLTLSVTSYPKTRPSIPSNIDDTRAILLHERVQLNSITRRLHTTVLNLLHDNSIDVHVKYAPNHIAQYCCPSDAAYCEWHTGIEGKSQLSLTVK